jgi:hypothetical protein
MNVEKTILGATKKDPTGGLISGVGGGHQLNRIMDLRAFGSESGLNSPKNIRFQPV